MHVKIEASSCFHVHTASANVAFGRIFSSSNNFPLLYRIPSRRAKQPNGLESKATKDILIVQKAARFQMNVVETLGYGQLGRGKIGERLSKI